MVIIPQELILIILEKLMDIDPFLIAKVSKYWYYKAMPKIWGCINLNNEARAKNYLISRRRWIPSNVRAYDFHKKFIQRTSTLTLQKDANCLKFITKLTPYFNFYSGTVVNIIRKCPNLEELDFRVFLADIPYEAIVRFCPKIHTIYVKHHRIPNQWPYPNVTLKSL